MTVAEVEGAAVDVAVEQTFCAVEVPGVDPVAAPHDEVDAVLRPGLGLVRRDVAGELFENLLRGGCAHAALLPTRAYKSTVTEGKGMGERGADSKGTSPRRGSIATHR